MELDDTALSETGLSKRRIRKGRGKVSGPGTGQGASGARSEPDRILVIACGALAREIIALIDQYRWDHIDLTCLPAKFHLYPDRITDAVSETVEKNRSDYRSIFVAYADCGTGGRLEARCRELGVRMIEGPHCYSFYEGNSAFMERADEEITTFYLTDFLVRQFDAFVWRPLGLDRHAELRDAYFGNYTKLVYQSQREDVDLQAKARDCAVRLNLDYEFRFTGYGDLETTMAEFAEPS